MGTGQSIADITPLTLLDFPDKVACIFWLRGCNLSCRYCYNVSLVKCPYTAENGREDYLNFLREREGFLDGVVLSGGECTLCPDLSTICREIRALGLAIKIDTNGTRPDVVRELVEGGLCDYIALDYKAPQDKFGLITGRAELFEPFSSTLDYLIARGFPFEVRTTVHPDLLDEDDINRIIADLQTRGYPGIYYLQHFFDTGHTLHHLGRPEKEFNPTLLRTDIPLGFRNFPVSG